MADRTLVVTGKTVIVCVRLYPLVVVPARNEVQTYLVIVANQLTGSHINVIVVDNVERLAELAIFDNGKTIVFNAYHSGA